MIPPEFDDDWSTEVKALYQHDMHQYWDRSLSVNQWNQYQSLLNTYLSLVDQEPKIEILDVGCAQATLALLLAERGHSVTALDIRQEFLDYASSRHEKGDIVFLQGNVLDADIESKFDLIFANQIVEHLIYPQEMVDQLRSLLKPGGRLIMTTPNWRYLINSLPSFSELGDTENWKDKQFTADGDGHFFAYKKSELMKIFQDSGFSKIESTVYETPLISGHLKFRYLHKLIPYKTLCVVDRLLLKIPYLRDLLSHQLMIIGTK